MKKGFKKIVVSAVLGLSVIISSGGLSAMNPLTVQAAVSKPKINLTKKTITVGRGSRLELYKNVIKSVKKGSYPIKSVKVASVKTANGKKIGIKNSPIRTTGRVPAKTLVFPSKKGTYKLRVTATDSKGGKTTSTVDFKVRPKKLSSYVKGMETLTVTKGASAKYLRGITYDSSKIKSIKVDPSLVDTDKIGTYKAYYNIIGIAGDKLRIVRKVNVKAESTYDVGPESPTPTPTKPSNPTPTANPATHVKGIADRVVVARSTNVNLMGGVTWDNEIASVKITNFQAPFNPTNFDLPWVGRKMPEGYTSANYYTHLNVVYTITPKVGNPVKVSKMMYIVDVPTAKDLANADITVYTSNNAVVPKGENNRHTCKIQVSADKIFVPYHDMYVCWNCDTEIAPTDYDWRDEHDLNSYLGVDGSVPGCGSGWYGDVEAFTVSR